MIVEKPVVFADPDKPNPYLTGFSGKNLLKHKPLAAGSVDSSHLFVD